MADLPPLPHLNLLPLPPPSLPPLLPSVTGSVPDVADLPSLPHPSPPPLPPPSLPLLSPSVAGSMPGPPLPLPGPSTLLPSLSLVESGRPQRIRRLPARYQDLPPEPPHPVPSVSESMPTSEQSPPEATVIQRVSLIVRNRFRTPTNNFGLWKDYLYRPSYDPDVFVSAEDLYRPHSSVAIVSNSDRTEKPSVYTNETIRLLLEWQNTGSATKSNEEVTRLVHKVLLLPEFRLEHLLSFDATRENQKADAAEEQSPFGFLTSFRCTDVRINVPSGSKLVPPRTFSIPGLYYRQITTLIKESFESPISSMFHFSPFKLFRQRPDSEASERVYSEMYDSDVFLEEHDKVQWAPTDDLTCKREKVVAALMFWSDATHLATFGTTKLWPIYMLFGNLSKYIRC